MRTRRMLFFLVMHKQKFFFYFLVRIVQEKNVFKKFSLLFFLKLFCEPNPSVRQPAKPYIIAG